MPRSQSRGKVGPRVWPVAGHTGGRMAQGWPVPTVRLGSPLLMGILQPPLQHSPGSLLGDSSRVFAPALIEAHWPTPSSQWRFKCSMRTSSGKTRALGMLSRYMHHLKGMSLLVRAWQNVVHWKRECTISLVLQAKYIKNKNSDLYLSNTASNSFLTTSFANTLI